MTARAAALTRPAGARCAALAQSGSPGMPAYVRDDPSCGRGGACEDAGLFVLLRAR